ncbi:uncharacterized protein VTP21DRAFT_9397 [Calcarisporiella thermophila]|uniref:uncharacterized protein n=1 Tax=Calcarisporiella thermophila TaxID=911321 RepID=UPI003741F336
MDTDGDSSLELSYFEPSTPYQAKVGNASFYSDMTSPDFCSGDNLSATGDYINHQLATRGFPSPLNFLNPTKEGSARIINCLFSLLNKQQRDSEQKEEVSDNLRRLQSEHEVLQSNHNGLKVKLEQAEREAAMLRARLENAEKAHKAEVEKHKVTKQELLAAKSNLQFAKTQFAHELRKRELNFNKLKDRVQKLTNEKYKASKITITLANPASRPTVRRQAGEESYDLHNEALEALSERENVLIDENDILRNLLLELYQEIEILLRGEAAKEGRILEKLEPAEDSLGKKMEASRLFKLPIHMAGTRMEERVRELLSTLREEWNHRPSSDPVVDPAELERKDQEIAEYLEEARQLSAELDQLKYVAEERKKVIDHFMEGKFFDEAAEKHLNSSTNEITMVEYDEQKSELERARVQLQAERRKFTEETIRMAKERAAMRAEREALEEEKRALKTQLLLKSLPDTPDFLKKSSTPSAKITPRTPHRLATSTADFSPLDIPTPLRESSANIPRKRPTLLGEDEEEKGEKNKLHSTPRISSTTNTTGGQRDRKATPGLALKPILKRSGAENMAEANPPPVEGGVVRRRSTRIAAIQRRNIH